MLPVKTFLRLSGAFEAMSPRISRYPSPKKPPKLRRYPEERTGRLVITPHNRLLGLLYLIWNALTTRLQTVLSSGSMRMRNVSIPASLNASAFRLT